MKEPLPIRIAHAALERWRLGRLRRKVQAGKVNETSVVTVYDEHGHPIQ